LEGNNNLGGNSTLSPLKTFSMKRLAFMLLFINIASVLFPQNFQIDWQQCFGGSETDIAYDIVQVDGGYFVLGGTNSDDGDISFTHGGSEVWCVKIDNSGNLIWEKTYGGSNGEGGFRGFKEMGSLNFYIVGKTTSNDGDISNNPYPGISNLWVIKIDSSGTILWERVIGNNVGFMYEMNAAPTSDGGLVIAAQIDSQGGDITSYFGGYDGWLIKLNSEGETEWDQAIGSETDFEFINGIIQTSDGGYLAGLYGTPQGAGSGNVECITQSTSKADAILFKLDSNGNKEWEQCYGGSGHDGIVRLLEIDDGYLVAAYGGSNDGDLQGSGWHGEMDIWLIRTDLLGNIIWQKCYGGSRNDTPFRIFQTANGGFTVFGTTRSNDGDVSGNHSLSEYHNDIWVIKISGDGELLYQKCFGGEVDERMYFGAIKKSDYNYVIAGSTNFGPSYDVQCTPHSFIDPDFWVFEISDTTTNDVVQNENEMGLKVYPNPAHDYVVFEVPSSIIQNSLHNKVAKCPAIIINNVLGNLMTKLPINTENTVWDTRNVKDGVYFYTIKSNAYQITGKILIRH